MQKYIILLLCGYFKICFASASNAPRNCLIPVYMVCDTDIIQEHIPGTEKELDIFCKKIVEALQCSIEHEKACKTNSVDLDQTEKFIALTKDVCRKNNPLYAAILESLKCAKPLMEDFFYKCSDLPSDKQLAKHLKVLLEKGIDAFPRNGTLRDACLHDLCYTACEIKEMGKCGETAVDALLSINQKYDSIVLEKCGDKIQKYYREIIQALNAKE